MTGLVRARAPLLASWSTYVRESFPPLLYLPLAAAWYAAAWGAAGGRGPLGLGVAHAGLVLLALRLVDDLKDLPYDRERHPDRPLPSGRVTPLQAGGLLAAAVLALLGLGAALGPAFLGLVALQLGWAGALAGLRRLLARRWLLELVLAQPLNLLLTLHAVLLGAGPGGLGPGAAPVVLAVWAAFLQVEVARKTRFQPVPGAHLYSELAGWRPAVAANLLLAGAAAAAVALVPGAGAAARAGVAAAWAGHASGVAAAARRRDARVLAASGAAFLAAAFAVLALGIRP